jgi:hypothetical protein
MKLSTGTKRAVGGAIVFAALVAAFSPRFDSTLAASLFNPNQIAPAGTNGFVLTTVSGVTAWAAPSGSYPGAGVAVSTGSAWGTSLTKVGTDTGSPTAGTLSGTGNPACVDSNGGIATGVCTQPLAIFIPGTMTNSQVAWYMPLFAAYTVPSSCSGSLAHAKVAATGSFSITVTDITTSTTLCTVSWSASGVTGSFSGSGGSISASDIVEVDGGGTADATLANIAINLKLTR